MNLSQQNVNFLYLPKSKEYIEELYSTLLQHILQGKTVAVLTQTAPKLLPHIEKLKIEVHRNKEILQRLIFICCENISAAIKKLFDLYDWSVKPDVIILDLCTFAYAEEQIANLSDGITKCLIIVPFLQQSVYCIAVLFNMINSLQNSKTISIVVAQEWSTILSTTQVELIKELYYDGNAYIELKRILDMVQ